MSEHRSLVETTLDCADAVAEADAVTTDAFERALRAQGVVDALPGVLTGVAETLETRLPARPVAAPPYVVVTRAGPVARATLPDRGRLVVTVAAFERRDGRWVRHTETPAAALTVELR
ncbi:hypothetical protein GQS65_00125 [Halomarina oriensis]|uniref:DUF7988 domain-containing protein n=1 Tax=Halomarina oriensis TaxID=671145 RepID=A0A6B0GJB0_9EURY|nr:hypothetical protein [Halomarina oriensis]